MNQSVPQIATSVFLRTVASMLLLWLSFPPIGWSGLAWVALLPLIGVIVDRRSLLRRHYGAIWVAGFCYWLATFYFIPIPHPLLWFGWVLISLYLACYLPLCVLSARTLIWRMNLPSMLAIPVAWTGWELIRCRLFTGMPLVSLAHTQYQLPVVIQISDLSGGYMLTFAIVLFATALHVGFVRDDRISRPRLLPTSVLIALVLSVFGYGYYQLGQKNLVDQEPLVVAIIQGSVDTVFPATEDEAMEHFRFKTQQYIDLTRQALERWNDIELVVWPENGWPYPDLEPNTRTAQMTQREIEQYRQAVRYIWPSLILPDRPVPHFLVGAETYDPVQKERYASALHISNEAEIVDRYYKKHLVMFGEYIPLAKWFSFLQEFPAIGTGIKAGEVPVTMDFGDLKIAPTICFESTVPHFVRSRLNELKSQGNEPDVMVNVTNDGWFYGTSCLDFHLACNVFRAVELRKPHLVCANTGLSAVINEKGVIEQRGPRRRTDIIRAEMLPVKDVSIYRTLGDTIPIAFAVLSLLASILAVLPNSVSQQDHSHQVPRATADQQSGDRDEHGRDPKDDP